MNEWEKTIHTNEFKNNDQVLAKANNAEVLLIKSNDEYFAVTSKCAHLGLGLKGGKVNSEEKTIACPWHDSQFCLKTGETKQWVAMSGIKKYLLFFIPKKTPLNATTFDVKIEDNHLWLKPN